jgi:hypothetical protein
MKRLISLLLLTACALPVWAAKKTSVQELKDTLISLNQNKKTDEEIATRLKDTEMSEELTRATLKDFAQYLPGPLSIEQMEVLEGRIALLPPPPSDLPNTPAPDVAAQKAILAKTVDYVTKTYMQYPHFTFYKSTARFQDGVESIRTNSGVTSNIPNSGNSWELPNMYMRFLGTHLTQGESDKGVEKAAVEKAKIPWGQNGQVSEGGLGPVLSIILGEAADGGKLNWLRWETINGIQTAVFSFVVDKKKSHYTVNYCCFPVTGDTGRMGYEGTGANFQTATDWKDFKATVGYHGEFFIDPKTGTIVRLITQAGLKPTDFVHQEDMRIDYAPVIVGGTPYILPIASFTNTEVVPNGDNYAARYSIRHTLFAVTYQNYALSSEVPPASK